MNNEKNISSELFSGVEAIVNSLIKKNPSDKTYKGIVKDKTEKGYTVLIDGISYENTPSISDNNLYLGSTVYVLFPCGSATKRVIISCGETVKEEKKKEPFQYGKATIPYHSGGSAGTVDVVFENNFKEPPVVVVSQVFNSSNIVVLSNTITNTGFRAVVYGVGAEGTRDFGWVAFGELEE